MGGIKVSDLLICKQQRSQPACICVENQEYEQQHERALQEAREQAFAARKQIAAELKGQDSTPLRDFEDDFGKPHTSLECRLLGCFMSRDVLLGNSINAGTYGPINLPLQRKGQLDPY